MIPVKVARVLRQEKSCHMIFVLLDEQHQMALPLLFTDVRSPLPDVRSTPDVSYDEINSTEPLTSDFIVHIIHALGGTIEEISIDALHEDLLYAHVRLHTNSASHTLKARLDDALLLALRLNCPLTVGEDVLYRMGVSLVGKGETQEKQIDAVIALMIWLPLRISPHPPVTFNSLLTSGTPRNLDFTQALRGWMVFGYPLNPKAYDIHFDSDITYSGKSTFAITLHDTEHSAQESVIKDRIVSLTHEGFLATNYRGQRLHMTAFARAEGVKRANFHLAVIGPTIEPNTVRITQHMTSTQLHPIEGTSDWTAYELVIDVPENANSIQVSFSLEGHGKVWLDSIRFTAVDKTIPLTGTRIIPPPPHPQNLDFAHGLEFWHLTGTFPQDYAYIFDSVPFSDSLSSICIASMRPEPRGSIILQQTLNPLDYRGQRVRFSATIKLSDVEHQAALFISTGIAANEEKVKRTFQGTSDWTEYDVILDIVNPNSYINFGLILHGQGQVRLADARFEVLGPIS